MRMNSFAGSLLPAWRPAVGVVVTVEPARAEDVPCEYVVTCPPPNPTTEFSLAGLDASRSATLAAFGGVHHGSHRGAVRSPGRTEVNVYLFG